MLSEDLSVSLSEAAIDPSVSAEEYQRLLDAQTAANKESVVNDELSRAQAIADRLRAGETEGAVFDSALLRGVILDYIQTNLTDKGMQHAWRGANNEKPFRDVNPDEISAEDFRTLVRGINEDRSDDRKLPEDIDPHEVIVDLADISTYNEHWLNENMAAVYILKALLDSEGEAHVLSLDLSRDESGDYMYTAPEDASQETEENVDNIRHMGRIVHASWLGRAEYVALGGNLKDHRDIYVKKNPQAALDWAELVNDDDKRKDIDQVRVLQGVLRDMQSARDLLATEPAVTDIAQGV